MADAAPLSRFRAALLAAARDDGADVPALEALAGLLAAPASALAELEALHALAATGIAAAPVLLALLRCQEAELEALLPTLDTRSSEARFDALRTLLARHGNVQTQWVDVCEQHHADTLTLQQSERERATDELLRSEALADWLRSRQLEVFNYFRELQVPAAVHVEEVHEGYLTVNRSARIAIVLAAGERGRVVFAQTRDPAKVLLLEFHGIRDEHLVFRIGNVRAHPQGARRRLRVTVGNEPHVRIRLPDGGASTASVRDFSVIGMGLEFTGRLPLPTGAQLRASGQLGRSPRKIDLDLHVTVRWIVEEGDVTRVGVELLPEKGQLDMLDRLVRDYEQEAIKALNLLADE